MKRVCKVQDLVGAVVIDNCGTLRLADGTVALFVDGVIGPENRLQRDYYEYGEGEDIGEGIVLPIVYG
jgi:hypothetical protein